MSTGDKAENDDHAVIFGMSRQEQKELFAEWTADYAAAAKRDAEAKSNPLPPSPSEIVRQARQQEREDDCGQVADHDQLRER